MIWTPSRFLQVTFLSAIVSLCGCPISPLGGPGGTPLDHHRSTTHGETTIDVAPSGNELVFDAIGNGQSDLYLLDLTTLQVTHVANTEDYESAPSFSPDGQQIVFSAGIPGDRADHIFVMRRDGSSREQLTDEDANDTSARFSPDGRTIVFAREKTHQWGGLAANWELGGVICLIDVQGQNLRELTSDKEYASNPRFSADGKFVEYSTQNGRRSIPVDGSAEPTPMGGPSDAVTSPDGKRIAYSKGKYLPDYEVYVANADGTAERVCTPGLGSCFRLAFAPTGVRLYFLRQEWPSGYSGVSKLSLWQVDIDGSNLREVANRTLFDDPLNWQPSPGEG